MNWIRCATTILLALTLLASGCEGSHTNNETNQQPTNEGPAENEEATSDEDPGGEPKSFDGDAGELIEKLDSRITFLSRRIQEGNDTWNDHADIARAYSTRARLTSNWKDYEKAEAAFERSFEMAPDKSGPLVARMSFQQAVHRFDALRDDLEAYESRPHTGKDPTTIDSVRAELKLQSGDVAGSISGLEDVHSDRASFASASRLANLYFKTGQLERAERHYDEASELASTKKPMTRAWIELQRGIFWLEQGKLDRALTRFEQADQIFSGWYLIEEHIAEVMASTGRLEEAESMYRDIVARVPAGEFQDALADVLTERGETDEAESLRKKARQSYEQNIEMFPLAAYGHATEHFLVYGDPARGLHLARANWDNRQSPDARLMLAQALIRNGEIEAAREHVEKTLESPWDTAMLHATAARLYQHLDMAQRVDEQRSAAENLNPGIMSDTDWLAPGTPEQ